MAEAEATPSLPCGTPVLAATYIVVKAVPCPSPATIIPRDQIGERSVRRKTQVQEESHRAERHARRERSGDPDPTDEAPGHPRPGDDRNGQGEEAQARTERTFMKNLLQVDRQEVELHPERGHPQGGHDEPPSRRLARGESARVPGTARPAPCRKRNVHARASAGPRMARGCRFR
jgi:hypothetical protein